MTWPRTIAYCFLAGAIFAGWSQLAFDTAWPGYIGAAIAGVMIGRRKAKGYARP